EQPELPGTDALGELQLGDGDARPDTVRAQAARDGVGVRDDRRAHRRVVAQVGAERPFLAFFYPSRRRHTNSKRDWSSDVCSSNLDETRRIWAALPPLAASAPLGAPRPGATLLAGAEAPGGRVSPVVAAERYGRGRSLVFAGEARSEERRGGVGRTTRWSA